MPALITHYLFAEQAQRLLGDGTFSSYDERAAFFVGNQGPDPLFFRHLTLPSSFKKCHELARTLHRQKPREVFMAMRDRVVFLMQQGDAASAQAARIARAFCLGFMGHYALDTTAHPIVYAQQYAVIEAAGKNGNADLEDAQSEVHALIESELDTWLLGKLKNSNTIQVKPEDVLDLPESAHSPAGLLVSFAARVVGLELQADEYANCVTDMKRVYQLIEPAGTKDLNTIALIEKIFRSHSMLECLAHQPSIPASCRWINEEKNEWANPFTGETSSQSFMELFYAALELYAKLVRCYTTGDFDPALFTHDYAGRALY